MKLLRVFGFLVSAALFSGVVFFTLTSHGQENPADEGSSNTETNASSVLSDENNRSAPAPEGNASSVVVSDGNVTGLAVNSAGADANDSLDGNSTDPGSPFLPSDFFSGALEAAQGGDDAMGTQRLIDVKSAKLTPSLATSVAYKYTSNPEKNELANRDQDGFTADLSLTFNMGLGEYGIGDEILLTPSLMFMHMRTYNDPVRDYGEKYKLFDVDVQIVGLTVPVVLPKDYTLAVGATYLRPISFRSDNVLSYTTTPNLALTKTLPLPTGDILSITAGTSFAFSSGDTPQDTLEASLFDFLMQATAGRLLADSPVNLQDAWTHNLNLSYIKPLGEKLTLTPSLSASMMEYVEGSNKDREDLIYVAGLNASYVLTEWMNLSAAANYTWKHTNRTDLAPEFEDFGGGLTLGVNYSF